MSLPIPVQQMPPDICATLQSDRDSQVSGLGLGSWNIGIVREQAPLLDSNCAACSVRISILGSNFMACALRVSSSGKTRHR